MKRDKGDKIQDKFREGKWIDFWWRRGYENEG